MISDEAIKNMTVKDFARLTPIEKEKIWARFVEIECVILAKKQSDKYWMEEYLAKRKK